MIFSNSDKRMSAKFLYSSIKVLCSKFKFNFHENIFFKLSSKNIYLTSSFFFSHYFKIVLSLIAKTKILISFVQKDRTIIINI